MDFLEWCRSSDKWGIHAWANDRRCRLPKGTPESPEAYAKTFTSAGYGSYLYRLEDRPGEPWGDYVRATGGPS